jgi:hypothetical protein
MGWEALLKETAVFVIFGFVVAWAGTYCINLIRVPSIMHHEQSTIIAAQANKIERLEKIPQLEFSFRLYSRPGPHISMKMNYAYGGMDVSVPFVGIAVSNKSGQHIEVVACELAKVRKSNQVMIETDQLIGPMDSEEVDVTRRFIELVAELREPNWDKIFGTYQIEVAVKCRAGKAEKPVKGEPRIFDVEISRTGRLALEITISPHHA